MALAAFERKIFRKIFGPVCTNGSWTLRHNEELYSMYRSADVISHIKLRRLEWAGHVYTRCRAPEFQKAYARESIRWRASGKTTQKMNRYCVPGCEGAAGCQNIEAGS
jgi:hypothetical protein